MPFPRRLLNEGEEVVVDLHPHWWFLFPSVAALVAAVVVGVVALANDVHDGLKIAAGVVVLVALGGFAVRYARWTTTNFVVTTDRLIYRHGVLAKRGIEIPLERVNTVFSSQTIFERMLGLGDLSIESGGETGKQTFYDIRKPSLVQNEIYRQMEDNENRKFDRIGRREGDGATIPERIEQLDGLRRRGVITDDEFRLKKTQLLDRM